MLKPKIVRRVKPHQDGILRDGAWTLMLPTSTWEGRYVARYCATHAAAITAVDDYYRYRGVLPVPEAPDAVELAVSRGISVRVIP